MQDRSSRTKRRLRVAREFETSRLEKGLLAIAYEHALPIISRRPSASQNLNEHEPSCTAEVASQADSQPSSTIKEGKVA